MNKRLDVSARVRMGMFLSLSIVSLAALFMAAMQAGLLIGAMFGVNKLWGDKFGPEQYGDIDLANIDQKSLLKLIQQTLLIVGPPTLLWFWIFCLLYATFWLPWLTWWPRWIVLLPHTAIVFGGLHVLYKLDWRKSAILAGAALLAYIILFWGLVPDNLFR